MATTPHVPPSGEEYAELADLVHNVGRLIRARSPEGPDVVSLNETERTVMRIVDLFPGASPSEIAHRARVKRTNVSATLRSLEAKELVRRTPSAGGGVEVTPTRLAADNLAALRDAWSRDLTSLLGPGEADNVRRCVALLRTLEERLVEDPS